MPLAIEAAATGLAVLVFLAGVGAGWLAFGGKAPSRDDGSPDGCLASRDRARERLFRDIFGPCLRLRVREAPGDGRDSIEFYGRLSIDVWHGGAKMPLAHLAHTVEKVARRMGLDPRKCMKPILEIAAVESDFGMIVRQRGGPALSPWQIEPASWDELVAALAEFWPAQHERLMGFYEPGMPLSWNRTVNVPYAAASAMMYIKTRYPGGFEGLGTIERRARMWKRWYNTPKGKGTVECYLRRSAENLLEPFTPSARGKAAGFGGRR